MSVRHRATSAAVSVVCRGAADVSVIVERVPCREGFLRVELGFAGHLARPRSAASYTKLVTGEWYQELCFHSCALNLGHGSSGYYA